MAHYPMTFLFENSLCGRGGSINSHPGNITFREWVYTRKTRYNLADSKREKTIVVNEVLNLVRALKPAGRFLQKFNTGWIEIDDAKAMAKISQALREGAPAMRAAHGKKATKRRSDSTRSPSPQRRESKRKAKKRKFNDYVPSEAIPAKDVLLSSNVAISSAPLTPPPSLEGNVDDYHHDDDLMKNDVYNYFDNTGGLNDLLDQSHGAAAIAGSDFQPQVQPQAGYYNAPSHISPHSHSHHPLIPLGDYRASLSEVASAIPPTQNNEQPPRANNVTPTLTSLPPPPFSPGGWDPLSFLPSTPKHARAATVEGFGQSFFPLTPVHTQGTADMPTSLHTSPDDANAQGQAFSLQQKPSAVRREHSLEASLGSFSNPFENDSNHFRQYPSLPPLPIPNNIGPPQRGLSFGMIGMPKAKEINASSRRDTSSYSSSKSYPSSSQDERKQPPL